MIEPKENLYKKRNIFSCIHDVHQHFKSEMSPFHILVQKQCYPHGCIYFQWRCRLLAKQKKCFRSFENVGRECFNCRYFYEEKIHQYPEFLPEDMVFSDFNNLFEAFESWVNSLQNRRVVVEGTVNYVSPELSLETENKSARIHFTGFLIRFNHGFIDNVVFNDPFYLRISSMTQQKLKIRSGDEMDFTARIETDKGRFKFIESGNFTFYSRSPEFPLQKCDILDKLPKSKIHFRQASGCLTCTQGILADIRKSNHGPTRAIVCLAGIENPDKCSVRDAIEHKENAESCANPGWKGTGCHQPLR
jgi:hypothetical protein